MAIVVLTALQLGLRRALKVKPRPFLNLAVAALAGIAANSAVGILAMEWGIDDEPLWGVRIIGGAISTSFLFYTVNTLQASLVARNESIRKLIETENQLLGYRDSAKQIIEDEIEQLKQKTQVALLPAIEKIQELIFSKAHQRNAVVDELRVLIQNDVRPLSKSIMEEAKTLSQARQFEAKAPSVRPLRLSRYQLRKTIRPLASLPILILTYPLLQFVIIDHRSGIRGMIGAVFTVVMFAILKAVIPARITISPLSGLFAQIVINMVAILPAYWVMWQEYGVTEANLWAILWMWLATIFSTYLLGYTRGVELNREQFEQNLSQFNAELAKEVALFEQKLGLEKRSWSRIIHGEVQSALTAALTRLQRSETLEPYELEMIKQDLNRAKENLINPPRIETNFNQAFSEIVFSWKSICNITADISARAQRAVDTNQDTRNVTNEIIKEAVSNAVRHAQAKNVNVKLDRIQDDILEIEISNDGYRPTLDQTPGLGAQMLDELTLSWQLTSNKNLTVLKAAVPIGKS